MSSRHPNPTVSEIEPGLFLGDLGSSYLECLTDNVIGAMVSLSDAESSRWRWPESRKLVPEDRHMFIPCLDTSTQDLLVHMTDICDFIEAHRKSQPPHNVLVHCSAGVSRSAAIVVAYLMRKYRQSLDSALASVKASRKVKPNSNFMEQLDVWDKTGYDIWANSTKTNPKLPYSEYLARRRERLDALGLTGNEPVCPDL